MPKKTWTINNAGGGPSGAKLVGCHIQETDAGYDFTAPNNSLLAATGSVGFPYRFTFRYDNLDWIVNLENVTSGASGNWMNDKADREQEDGSWSAGAGTEP